MANELLDSPSVSVVSEEPVTMVMATMFHRVLLTYTSNFLCYYSNLA